MSTVAPPKKEPPGYRGHGPPRPWADAVAGAISATSTTAPAIRAAARRFTSRALSQRIRSDAQLGRRGSPSVDGPDAERNVAPGRTRAARATEGSSRGRRSRRRRAARAPSPEACRRRRSCPLPAAAALLGHPVAETRDPAALAGTRQSLDLRSDLIRELRESRCNRLRTVHTHGTEASTPCRLRSSERTSILPAEEPRA